jgi:hypothetical protein
VGKITNLSSNERCLFFLGTKMGFTDLEIIFLGFFKSNKIAHTA